MSEPKKHEPVPTYKGISIVLLRGALQDFLMKDWTEEEKKEAREKMNEQN